MVDERGEPEKVLQSENDESHQLVEEFMLLANDHSERIRKKKVAEFSEYILTPMKIASMN